MISLQGQLFTTKIIMLIVLYYLAGDDNIGVCSTFAPQLDQRNSRKYICS